MKTVSAGLLLVAVGSLASVEACDGQSPSPSSAPSSGGVENSASAGTAPDRGATATARAALAAHRADGFTAALAAEPRDSEWASLEERGVRAAISESRGTTLLDVECKTTVCILHLSHDSFESMSRFRGEFIPTLRHVIDMKSRHFADSTRSDPKTLKTTMFLTRDGYGVPKEDGAPLAWP